MLSDSQATAESRGSEPLGLLLTYLHAPSELGDLPLVRLDFSCNRISRIPISFCRLRHLQVILLDSNPLQSPPAQVRGGPGADTGDRVEIGRECGWVPLVAK